MLTPKVPTSLKVLDALRDQVVERWGQERILHLRGRPSPARLLVVVEEEQQEQDEDRRDKAAWWVETAAIKSTAADQCEQ